jgi:hypothetical protein
MPECAGRLWGGQDGPHVSSTLAQRKPTRGLNEEGTHGYKATKG